MMYWIRAIITGCAGVFAIWTGVNAIASGQVAMRRASQLGPTEARVFGAILLCVGLYVAYLLVRNVRDGEDPMEE